MLNIKDELCRQVTEKYLSGVEKMQSDLFQARNEWNKTLAQTSIAIVSILVSLSPANLFRSNILLAIGVLGLFVAFVLGMLSNFTAIKEKEKVIFLFGKKAEKAITDIMNGSLQNKAALPDYAPTSKIHIFTTKHTQTFFVIGFICIVVSYFL